MFTSRYLTMGVSSEQRKRDGNEDSVAATLALGVGHIQEKRHLYRLLLRTGAHFLFEWWAIIVIRNVRQDGGGLWRTHAGLAEFMPLGRGCAGLVALPAEGFASSSL